MKITTQKSIMSNLIKSTLFSLTNTRCFICVYKGVIYFFHKFYCSFSLVLVISNQREFCLRNLRIKQKVNIFHKYISKCMRLLQKWLFFNLCQKSLLLNTIFKFKISACKNASLTNKREPAVINFTQEITEVKNLWSYTNCIGEADNDLLLKRRFTPQIMILQYWCEKRIEI